ncbi:MAG TPA: homocysteine S-methyltransferase [Gemmatimonadaceae bacterium]|nr:homocysteine S-methyltransferase [Gemmatimonadaceae bacterium]
MDTDFDSDILILDGGLATELEKRGYDISGPLWSAQLLLDAPDAIEQLHYDYFASGAQCVTSASYQASYGGFASLGFTPEETTLVLQRSVALARSARDRFEKDQARDSNASIKADGKKRYVAASVGPYGATLHDGSEYHGNYGLSVSDLKAFHAPRFSVLADSGADVLACETIPSLDEARALLDLLGYHGHTQAWLSFTSPDGVHTSHGEPLADCARAADSVKSVFAVGVNCVHPRVVTTAIRELARGTEKPIVVYPNSGEQWDAGSRQWRGAPHGSRLADLAPAWVDAGARFIGGCCRTGPADTAALARAMSST